MRARTFYHAYGVVGCSAADNEIDQLGVLLKEYESRGLPRDLTYQQAKTFFEQENSIWTGMAVAIGDACTNLRAMIKKHTDAIAQRLNASATSSTQTYDPTYGPQDPGNEASKFADVLKLALGAAIVMGVAYTAGPVIRAIASRHSKQEA